MTGPDIRKAVALLDDLPEQALVELQARLTPDQWQAAQNARAGALELSPHERTAATVDFFLAMAGAGESEPKARERLEQADAASLVSVLCDEHPQTIALALTRFSSARSAKILALLSADVRSIVARRIATTEMADEQAIRDVEELLAVRLAALPAARFASIDGVAALGEILQSLDREREHEIITGLAHDEPHLAEAVASHAFAIEDLLDWSRASAQILLAHVETAPLAVALKATTAEVRHKILDLLPAQFAERLRHAVAHLGVVPRAIAEQSRHTIAGTLRRLQSEGKIRIEPVPPSRLVA